MKVIVASKNPVKIKAVETGFGTFFPGIRAEGFDTASGVPAQPLTDRETLTGARNRCTEAKGQYTDADFWVGIEGGIEKMDGGLAAFAWIVIRSAEKSGEARTGTFMLPEKVSQLVAGGLELGSANDIVFNASNSKQKNGAVGLLTHNAIDRLELYRQAIVLALIPFVNPDLY